MKSNKITEVGTGLLLIIVVGVLTYAHETWMPNMATMLALVLMVAFFGAFALFVWREKDGDEREQLIRFIASRAAFLATGGVLLLGIIIETIVYNRSNSWLGIALVVMVVAKIIGNAYGQHKY